MTARERVMTALRREQPDVVPWVEVGVDEGLQRQIMGSEDFAPPDFCHKLGLDGFGYYYPRRVEQPLRPASDDPRLDFYYPTKVTFDFPPPWIAAIEPDPVTGRKYVGKGLLTSRDSLRLFDEVLPDPDHPARYEQVAGWLAKYKQEFAVFARVRLGATNTLESMGLDVFAYMLQDDPGFIHEVHARFSEWTARVIQHLNELDFDFIWATDDLACNTGPLVSPGCFREFILPHMRTAAREIKKPWVFHSDGDLFPILPDLLTLGMAAIHPIQPSCMDIARMKREYGDRVAIVGNIDLDYTLTRGSPEDVEAEVRLRIDQAAPGGGYIISSANSLTDYCRPENVLAMAGAIKKYGQYPAGPG